MLKLKEEFDYKSLSRRLDIQLDKLIAEHERQQKAFENEIERITTEAQNRISEVERNYEDALEVISYFSISSIFYVLTSAIKSSNMRERPLEGGSLLHECSLWFESVYMVSYLGIVIGISGCSHSLFKGYIYF